MFKHVSVAIALLAAPAAVLSGCSSTSSDNQSTTTTSGSAIAETLRTQLNSADGKQIADATIDFTGGYATVTVETVAGASLAPGFHGLHIHAIGLCEANSNAPDGGPSGDFNSAGEHFEAPGHTGPPASGDLPPLLVRSDGSGKLVATSDAFNASQLKDADGSSIVIHQGADMQGASSDTDTRIGCGVLSAPSNTSSVSTSTSTSTSTVTSTTVSTEPTNTVTVTPSTSTSTAPNTSTSTVTQTTITTTPIPIPIPNIPNVPGPNG